MFHNPVLRNPDKKAILAGFGYEWVKIEDSKYVGGSTRRMKFLSRSILPYEKCRLYTSEPSQLCTAAVESSDRTAEGFCVVSSFTMFTF